MACRTMGKTNSLIEIANTGQVARTRNDKQRSHRSWSDKTAKLAETMAEKLTDYRQISDRFVQLAGKRTSGTDFAPEQVE